MERTTVGLRKSGHWVFIVVERRRVGHCTLQHLFVHVEIGEVVYAVVETMVELLNPTQILRSVVVILRFFIFLGAVRERPCSRLSEFILVRSVFLGRFDARSRRFFFSLNSYTLPDLVRHGEKFSESTF